MFSMQRIIFLLMTGVLLTLSSCKGSKKAKVVEVPGVQFSNSETLTAVLDQALAEDKLVFLDFYTTWCLPCRLMDEEVFPNERVGDFMNENFISYKVDAEKGNGVNLAFVYEVNAYPTLLFLDAKGNVLEKKIGAAFHEELMDLGRRALSGVN